MAEQQNQNRQNNKQQQAQRNIQNNANNIKNAADVAMASKNPYAMAAGAAVKGLDKLTGGKSTQALGKAMNTANKISPGGKQLQNASNKLSESGASDKIGQAAAMKNKMSGSDASKAAGGASDTTKALENKQSSRGQNNSGFGNSKSGLFSPRKDSSESQSGSASSELGASFKKAKNTWKIIVAIAPILFPMIICAVVAFVVIGQIMIIRDNIADLVQQFSTGIEKFGNLLQGDGWSTEEEAFFNHLNEEYENFPYTGGENLDIALIAATIHYSTTVDLSEFEEDENNTEESKAVPPTTGTLDRKQTVAFYNDAKYKLGKVNTLWPGQKRLLGHVVKTEITWDMIDVDAAGGYWSQFFSYLGQTFIATAEDAYWNTPLKYTNPLAAIAQFIDTYRRAQKYVEDYGNVFYELEYDAANLWYEAKEFVNTFASLFNACNDSTTTDENGNRVAIEDQNGFFKIPAPIVTRTMNYGYAEYNLMQQDIIRMKSILTSNGVNYETDDDVLDHAKNSSNTELKTLYEDYEKNKHIYMYSYTHYLQNVYIPFNYCYNRECGINEIDKMIDEIYDQRDFYYHLMSDNYNDVCERSTQAGDLSSMTDTEFINFIGPIAQLDYNKTGVLASVTIAQAILESEWGSSVPANSNNIFAIKCDESSKDKCVLKGTGEEYVPGQITDINDYFRVYDSVEDSIQEHSNLLINSSYYSGITKTTDYVEQINIIKNGGYSTDNEYVSKLTSIIEENNLTKWDVIINSSSNTLMCGPLTSGGWSIRSTVPTGIDKAFTYVNSNRGQCVWYVQARAIEIIQELASKGKISNEQMEKIKYNLLYKIPGNAEAWYRNGKKSFKSSNNIRDLQAGSIIVWTGGSAVCNPRCGHVAIVEEVTATSVTITDGWATSGRSCPYSWDCVNMQIRTMSLDAYFEGVANAFNPYGGETAQSFAGYIYFLEPL